LPKTPATWADRGCFLRFCWRLVPLVRRLAGKGVPALRPGVPMNRQPVGLSERLILLSLPGQMSADGLVHPCGWRSLVGKEMTRLFLMCAISRWAEPEHPGVLHVASEVD